ncbi:Transmembrane protein 59 [Camponotus floridanus]|uniref:Transmembrane protein 59 n=1 Tax=Camponotus floridanus TaxID=104421 RepID=E2A7R7_CAMFO|nr:transmembrane protein 59-like isoform X2 [Camponotus floridanus]EFN70535.1 Transmembrane protein 59 [Camponotus floridanus]
MKIGEAEITALLMLMVAELTRGDTFYTREDPCINLCENLLIFQSTDSSNNIYVKSCCQRGCRFFNLVDLHPEREPNSLNGTRDACETSCTEAYTNLQDRYVCSVGCDFMAKAKNPRISELLSRLPISVFYRIEEDIDSNVLLMSPDVPENDILTDPGLRKELLPGWWDTDGFKLPQTYVKTVPMDAGTVDYALSSDYSGETEQTSMSGSDWFHCALKQIRIPYWDIGVPYWLFAFAIAVFIMLSMMWLCLSTGDVPTTSRKDVLIDMSSSPKVALYMPDEAPLYKEPPPKYEYSSNHCKF